MESPTQSAGPDTPTAGDTNIMRTRREILQGLSAALGCSPVLLGSAGRGPRGLPAAGPRAGAQKEVGMPATDSDVGSLFPFIQSQAVKGEASLSFLREEF